MVIGNGSIANIFKNNYQFDNDIIIFASGVSNSTEKDSNQFLREKDLLVETLEKYPNKKLVYFSSIFVGYLDTPYYAHKKNIEEVIKNSDNYLIIRLPQLISNFGNPKNLINFFKSSLLSGSEITVFKNCSRAIIDIADVLLVSHYLIRNIKNDIINFASIEYVEVVDIIIKIASILKVQPRIKYVEYKTDLKIDNSPILNQLIRIFDINKGDYTNTILKKYLLYDNIDWIL